MKDKYLKITLHDNDFNWELQNVCRLLSMYLPSTKLLFHLQAISDTGLSLSSYNNTNTELHSIIVDVLCVFYRLRYIFNEENSECSIREYFDEQLDIEICNKYCNKENMSNSNNDEDFFIRLFNYYTNELEWFFV